MLMQSVIGNRKEWELSSHFCQAEVENNHSNAFLKGVKGKHIMHNIKKKKRLHLVSGNTGDVYLDFLDKVTEPFRS